MQYQVEISKSNASVGSLFSLLVKQEKTMQEDITAIMDRDHVWMKEIERFPTMVYPKKDGMSVILAVVIMIEASEHAGDSIIDTFKNEGYTVSL